MKLKLALTIAFFGTTGLASASGYALIDQNASGSGNAFAGAAAIAEDASTIFFNPAGMSYLPNSQFVAAGQAIKPTASFNNNDSKTIGPLGTPVSMRGGNGGDPGSWAFLPNFYYAKAVTDSIHLGLGVNSPFGLETQYDNGWAGRYQALKSQLQTININPSVSFKANDRLSLGAGINIQYADTTLSNALDVGTICYGKVNPATCGAMGLTPQNSDGNVSINGNDWGVGYNLGVIFRPIESTRIGIAYRSRISYTLRGNATFSNIATPLAGAFPNSVVTANFVVPDSVSSSLVHQLNNQWDILADATWTHWSLFKQLKVVETSGVVLNNQPENWQDTMRYSIGASYRYTEKLKFRVGSAYDQTPVKDAYRTARIPDNNRIWMSVGANYKLSSSNSFDAGYTHVFINNASINQGAVGTVTGQLQGSYNSSIDIISVQYTHTF
jgi:long-chain fatty acid transport protein